MPRRWRISAAAWCRSMPRRSACRHDWFDDKFREPMFTLRMTHYPQQEPTAPADEWGLAPHADTSFMTILAQNKVPGLSLRLPDGALDRRAGAGGRLPGEWRHDAAALDQPRLPGHAAPGDQPVRPGTLRHPVLHGLFLRRGDGADPDLRDAGQPAALPALHLSRNSWASIPARITASAARRRPGWRCRAPERHPAGPDRPCAGVRTRSLRCAPATLRPGHGRRPGQRAAARSAIGRRSAHRFTRRVPFAIICYEACMLSCCARKP